MAYIVMAYIVMARIVMAYIVMARMPQKVHREVDEHEALGEVVRLVRQDRRVAQMLLA